MPCRRCPNCNSNYPAEKGRPTDCPECGSTLIYKTYVSPDTEWPPEIPEVLPTLDSETEWKLVLEWRAIEAEAKRRGPRWSCADVLAEWDGQAA